MGNINDLQSGSNYFIQPVSQEKAKRIKRENSNVHPHVIKKRFMEKGSNISGFEIPPEHTLLVALITQLLSVMSHIHGLNLHVSQRTSIK